MDAGGLPVKRLRLEWVPLFAAAAVMLAACTPRPPEILRVEAELRLVTDRETDREYEQLSLFVEGEDPDGFEDLDELVLLNDQAGLYWRIDRSRWVVTREGRWIGSAALTMPLLSAFPRGDYRLVLYDAGGNSQETIVSVAGPRQAVPAPELVVDQEGIELTAPEALVVQVVDPQGRTIAQKRIFAGRHSWQVILGGGELPLDARAFLYLDSPGEGVVKRLPRIVGPFFL